MPIVLVTHDLDDVRRLADRLCVMHRGQVLQRGTTQDVLARPASATVAELLDIG
jgi:ABC-type proline/glycine betaine transport system ATPase subunit